MKDLMETLNRSPVFLFLQAFNNALDEWPSLAGWQFLNCKRDNFLRYVLTLEVKCDHGETLALEISELLLSQVGSGSMEPLVMNAIQLFGKQCAWNHKGDSTGGTGTLDDIARVCPAIKTTKIGCPCCKAIPNKASIYSIIIHLNDSHRWSREKIADWLDALPYDLTIVEGGPPPVQVKQYFIVHHSHGAAKGWCSSMGVDPRIMESITCMRDVQRLMGYDLKDPEVQVVIAGECRDADIVQQFLISRGWQPKAAPAPVQPVKEEDSA